MTCTSAYDHPLSSKAIREAYFLGQRNDEKVTDFLAQYIKRLPTPEKGPSISEISLYTPYAQVVLRSWREKMGYSAQQAQQDFLSHDDTIRVKVRIEFTATYSALQGAKPDRNVEDEQTLAFRPKDFWRDFQIELSQMGKQIDPQDVQGSPIYNRGFKGAEVWLVYDTNAFGPEETVVDVITPDSHRVTAKFDLSRLP